MFEAKTYWEKRAALNEILLQQLLNESLRPSSDQSRMRLMDVFSNYARGQQGLRDQEATRIMGEPQVNEDEYISLEKMRDYLEANLGRTYFGFSNHTTAPDGAIGTAGFSQKFNDWVHALPDLDESFGQEMESGFYKDTSTRFGKAIPLFVVRDGLKITVVIFNQHYSAMTLNLLYAPEDYRWDAPTHYALRGEMYTYRGDISYVTWEKALSEAIAKFTDTPMVKPAAEEPVLTEDVEQPVRDIASVFGRTYQETGESQYAGPPHRIKQPAAEAPVELSLVDKDEQ